MNLKPRQREEPEINLVSLIDVVLMLVVFFMLSSTFLNEGRVRIRLPEASSTPVERPEVDSLVVTVTQAGGYRLNERELVNSSADTLRAALVKEAGTDRSARVTLRADARATHQSVVTAMDVLARLGFAEVQIATVQESPTGTP
ncbi:MAG TPA: biopolymer transporter ExbD [Steroidobacteraceae bacterium]|nr:biopolymer transporter ExbD [Steroidobacteraceae bacterium]